MPSVFSWLKQWRSDELVGALEAIFIAQAAGEPMRRIDEIEAVRGQGLAGDRYATGQGHWRSTDSCQLTLVTAEDLRRAERRSGLDFSAGQHRRNLVVSGIPLDAFRRSRVHIGDVELGFHRLRPPCGYLDRVFSRGAGKALGRGAGVGLKVVVGGVLRAGDAVRLIPAQQS